MSPLTYEAVVGQILVVKRTTFGCDVLMDPFAGLMPNVCVSVQKAWSRLCVQLTFNTDFCALINSLIYYVNDLRLAQIDLFIYF